MFEKTLVLYERAQGSSGHHLEDLLDHVRLSCPFPQDSRVIQEIPVFSASPPGSTVTPFYNGGSCWYLAQSGLVQ